MALSSAKRKSLFSEAVRKFRKEFGCNDERNLLKNNTKLNVMAIEIHGPIAYEMKTGDTKPLTDSHAYILITEYAKIGLSFKKGKWKGEICVYVRAQADDYKSFRVQHAIHWKEIHNRAGLEYLKSIGNSYEPGRTSFSPSNDWAKIVNYIEKTLFIRTLQ